MPDISKPQFSSSKLQYYTVPAVPVPSIIDIMYAAVDAAIVRSVESHPDATMWYYVHNTIRECAASTPAVPCVIVNERTPVALLKTGRFPNLTLEQIEDQVDSHHFTMTKAGPAFVCRCERGCVLDGA